MRNVGQLLLRTILGCLVGCIFLAGCSKQAEQTPGPSASASKQAPVDIADRYRSDREATSGPALEHVKLPDARQPQPLIVLHTSQGDIKLRLDAEKAPRTVYNFISYVNSGHYNNTIFHQVEKGYALLAGGFTEDLVEKPSRYAIPNEAKNGLKNRKGTIAMARRIDDPDSATCQFIINLNDNPAFDYQGDEPDKYGFCVFGEVVDGWESLEKIATAEVRDTESFARLPVNPIKIQSVQTLR